MLKTRIQFLLFLVVWSVCSNAFAQDFSLYSSQMISNANTAAGSVFLSDEEKKTVLLINLARMDGPAFIQRILNPYVEQYKLERTEYHSSLVRDLKALPALLPLQVQEELCSSARFHASDMGQTGKIGHHSSDGTLCFDRIRRFYSGGAMAENCSYGFGDAAGIVIQLLIDDGIPGLGHRKNMLAAKYRRIGVGMATHSVYRFNCVMDFSD